MPKNIIIGCSPRTGSTLLQLSLAAHPQAICASEWLNPRLQDIAPKAYYRKVNGLPCNLFKIFGHQYENEGFDDIIKSGVLIHLTRNDRQAQQASFLKAVDTGQWMANHPPGRFRFQRPDNWEALLQEDLRFSNLAAMSISYEFMIANWNLVIWEILRLAEWQLRELPMATNPMPKENNHDNTDSMPTSTQYHM